MFFDFIKCVCTPKFRERIPTKQSKDRNEKKRHRESGGFHYFLSSAFSLCSRTEQSLDKTNTRRTTKWWTFFFNFIIHNTTPTHIIIIIITSFRVLMRYENGVRQHLWQKKWSTVFFRGNRLEAPEEEARYMYCSFCFLIAVASTNRILWSYSTLVSFFTLTLVLKRQNVVNQAMRCFIASLLHLNCFFIS